MRTLFIVAAVLLAFAYAVDEVTDNYEAGVSGAAAVLAANRQKVEADQAAAIKAVNDAFEAALASATTAEEKKALVEKRLADLQAIRDGRDAKIENANDNFRAAHGALRDGYKEAKQEAKQEAAKIAELSPEEQAKVVAEKAAEKAAETPKDKEFNRYKSGITGASAGLKAERAKLEAKFAATEAAIQADFEAAIVKATTPEEKKALVEKRLAAIEEAKNARDADVQEANDSFRSAHKVIREVLKKAN